MAVVVVVAGGAAPPSVVGAAGVASFRSQPDRSLELRQIRTALTRLSIVSSRGHLLRVMRGRVEIVPRDTGHNRPAYWGSNRALFPSASHETGTVGEAGARV